MAVVTPLRQPGFRPEERESRVSPWRLGGLSVKELGKRVWNEASEDEIFDRAAALSYYFVFALFPALLFLTSLLGMLPIPNLMSRLMAYTYDVQDSRPWWKRKVLALGSRSRSRACCCRPRS